LDLRGKRVKWEHLYFVAFPIVWHLTSSFHLFSLIINLTYYITNRLAKYVHQLYFMPTHDISYELLLALDHVKAMIY